MILAVEVTTIEMMNKAAIIIVNNNSNTNHIILVVEAVATLQIIQIIINTPILAAALAIITIKDDETFNKSPLYPC